MKRSIYHGANDVDIEYVFKKMQENSDAMVVSFPGALGGIPHGLAGTDEWGYMVTLSKLNINVLFIKSNLEYGKSRMTFHKGKPIIEEAVTALIKQCAKECGAKRIITTGSSMGGFCSLYYGLKNDWDIIAGSSAYGFDDDSSVLYATGKQGAEAKNWLNELLPTIIREAGKRGYHKKCFVSYGEGEPLWRSAHKGKKLVALLDEAHVPYELKLYPFTAHSTNLLVFPSVLTWKLKSYLGLLTDEEENDGEELLPEMEVAKAWDNGCVSMLSLLDKKNTDLKPCLGIKGCSHYGDKKNWNALRNFVYLRHGWFWDNNAKEPVHMDAGDGFWRIATKTNNNRACGFLFQDALLNYLEQRDDDVMLDWLVENTREYLACLSVNARGRWFTDIYRAHFLIAFHVLVAQKNKNPEWQAWISEEIDNSLRKAINQRGAINSLWRYRFLLLAFHVAYYYSNDEDLYREMCSLILSMLEKLIEFDFDENGLCVSGQVQLQDNLCVELHRIMTFLEINGFADDRTMRKLKRKIKKIESVSSHLANPNGFLAPIGASVVEKSRYIAIAKRIAENLILQTSNFAVLEDEASVSYITVGGGKNIHAARRHCDLLSFTWWYDGKQIFCDAGDGLADCEQYANMPIAHTAFICENHDYVTPDYSDWTTIDDVEENEKQVLISMSHCLLDGIEMKRKFIWLKPNVIILIDAAESEEELNFTQNFLLENYPLDRINNQRDIVRVAPGVDVSITQCLLSNEMTCEEYHGTDDAKDTEHFRGSLISRQAVPRKGLNLAYTQKGRNPKFVTVIECHSATQKAVEENYVKKLHFSQDGKITLDLQTGDNKK